MSTILITGIAGSLARLTALRILQDGHRVVGVDYRKKPDSHPNEVPYTQANYNKTRIEDVFRRERPEVVIHLGRVGNLKVHEGKRFDLNVVGSAKVMELSLKYNVKRLLVLSTFHIYGAHHANHIPIYEDEPLRAATRFPQLGDAVQLDNMASQWTYRHPTLRTLVLRPCNVVGPDINNAITRFLRLPRIPHLLGFSPMWQFIHQEDMIDAIHTAWQSDAVGVFNVAGVGAVPLRKALSLTGRRLLPIPAPMASAYVRYFPGMRPFPPYLIDFFKYPVVISDERFRKHTGFQPRITIRETLSTL